MCVGENAGFLVQIVLPRDGRVVERDRGIFATTSFRNSSLRNMKTRPTTSLISSCVFTAVARSRKAKKIPQWVEKIPIILIYPASPVPPSISIHLPSHLPRKIIPPTPARIHLQRPAKEKVPYVMMKSTHGILHPARPTWSSHDHLCTPGHTYKVIRNII
jgi:hypothetical protein